VISPRTGYKDKKHPLIGQVSKIEFDVLENGPEVSSHFFGGSIV